MCDSLFYGIHGFLRQFTPNPESSRDLQIDLDSLIALIFKEQ